MALSSIVCIGIVGLVTFEPGLCHEYSNLSMDIRGEINSALSGLTCTINNSPARPVPPPYNESYINMVIDMVITRLDAISNKIDTLEQKLIPLGSSHVHPASSCAEILQEYPESSSGYYWVGSTTGHAHSVYCDMTRTCGGVTGGWMRVAYLDMSNPSHQCPSSLHQRTDSNVRSCAVKSHEGSCSTVWYESHGIHYSRVCGKVHGYFFNTPDAFGTHNRLTPTNINSNYVDGVSLTYDRNNRHHIWTFAASHLCPCGDVPTFIGSNYFCDTRQHGATDLNNPLWDGEGCGSNTCCTYNNPPWFYRQLSHTTTEDIEMRLCRDQERDDEDTAIGTVEIYVQ